MNRREKQAKYLEKAVPAALDADIHPGCSSRAQADSPCEIL